MLVTVKVIRDVNLLPGDKVEYYDRYGNIKTTAIKRMVENRDGVYAVFTNRTWRPVSTHGVTWSKVWGDN